MNKRTAVTIAAIVLAGVVAAGTLIVLRDPAPAWMPVLGRSVVPSSTVDPSQAANDAWFLRAVRIDFPDAPAESTVRLGHTYCDLMDSGVTLKQIIDHADAKYLAGVVAGAAIVVFCPQHEGQIHQ
jgi:uncharacterized protein DUF732